MIINVIKKLWDKQEKKKWYETYWAIDLHGTIIKPDHINYDNIDNLKDLDINFYPYVKDVLRYLTKRDDIKLILYTSTKNYIIELYLNEFIKSSIKFDYVNENPEIKEKHFGFYDHKFYRDVLIDDKAGFDPETEWRLIYELLNSDDSYKPLNDWKRFF